MAEAGEKDVDRAVKAARAAYEDSWGSMPGKERAKYLFRIARMVQERSRELAVLETMDGGKPIKESRDVDLPLVAAHFFYYAGWADKLEYAFPGLDPKPLGVAGQVIPWNFPMMMLAWKVAPALATGNTVVLKPAETTPLTALIFASLAAEAGLPPGVLNVVTGAGATGSSLVNHPDVDKVAFTGSTAVGKLIRNSLAGTGKKLTLELGGKAAHVIFDDAPIDQAIEGVINGIFFNQGHVCCAGSRLFVQESIHDRFVDKLKRRLSTLRVGDPLDKNTDVGAINSPSSSPRSPNWSKSGRAEGAEMFQPDCVLPAQRLLVPADPVHRRQPEPSHRPGRDLRAGPLDHELPDSGRSHRESQQHPLRLVGGGVDLEGLADPVDGRPPPGRGGVGQHLQQVRSGLTVRRLQGVRIRTRGRTARAAGLPARDDDR